MYQQFQNEQKQGDIEEFKYSEQDNQEKRDIYSTMIGLDNDEIRRMQKDIYSYIILKILKNYQNKNLFFWYVFGVAFIFFVLGSIWLCFHYYLTQKVEIVETTMHGKLARISAIIFLSISLFPEYVQGNQKMFAAAYLNKPKFITFSLFQRWYIWFMGLGQTISAIMTQFICVFSVLQVSSPVDIFTQFVVFAVFSQLDDWLCNFMQVFFPFESNDYKNSISLNKKIQNILMFYFAHSARFVFLFCIPLIISYIIFWQQFQY